MTTSQPGSKPVALNDFKCSGCDDQRYIRYDVVRTDSRFGKVYPCPMCNETTIEIISGLNSAERLVTFEKVITGRNLPGTTRAKEAAEKFVNNPVGFLSIHGEFGNGKTTLLMAVVNALVSKGIEARYLTASALMAYLRESFNDKTGISDYERLHELAAMPVLVIDELDKLRDTPYSRELQQELIGRRYRDKDTLGTVCAWNGALESLPWGAVISRLSEGVVIHNTDLDMRKKLGEA